jgi:hypothetical protein
MNDERQRAYTLQVIVEAERLIGRVDAAVAQHEQLLASRGIDRETVRRQLDALSPAMRARVNLQVEQAIKEAEERGQQVLAHAQFSTPNAPRSRRIRNRV